MKNHSLKVVDSGMTRDTREKLFWVWIIGVTIIILGMIGWSCWVYISNTSADTLRSASAIETIETTKLSSNDLPGILKDTTLLTPQQTKETLLALTSEQHRILRQQETLADDLRQETNNYINKANGHISIWIGIFALFGILVPIVLQFKLQYNNREKIEELFKKFDVAHKQLDGDYNALTKRAAYDREQIQRQVACEIDAIHQERDKSELSNLTRTLEICNDYRMIPNYTDAVHTPIQNLFWHQSLQIFSRIIDESFEKTGNQYMLKSDQRDNLLQTLIILFGVVRNYILPPNSHRNREYENAINLLRTAISALSENTPLSSPTYRADLLRLHSRLASLF